MFGGGAGYRASADGTGPLSASLDTGFLALSGLRLGQAVGLDLLEAGLDAGSTGLLGSFSPLSSATLASSLAASSSAASSV